MFKIFIEDAEGQERVAKIDPRSNDITIGRKEGNFIRLKERNVSREHARIYMSEEDELFVEPVAARYGLKVNSQKIEGPTKLNLGDVILIGDYKITIEDENAPDTLHKPKEESETPQPIDPQYQPRLVVVSSNFAGQEFHINKTRVVIGRAPECDYSIPNNSVSGRHAEIRQNQRGNFEIADLNSSNKTIVNGVCITGPSILSSGDLVALGHVVLRFCAPGDLWFMDFGKLNQPKSNVGLIIGIVSAVIAIIMGIVVFHFYTQAQDELKKIRQDAEKQQQESQQKDAKIAELNSLLQKANDEMNDGNLEDALARIKKAEEIDPLYEPVMDARKKYDRESSAKTILNRAMKYLNSDPKQCLDAISELEDLLESYDKTWAANRAKSKEWHIAINCRIDTLLEGAMNAVENGDFNKAEINRDEIRDLDSHSSAATQIDEAIKAKKAAARRAAAPAPTPAANADNAQKAKMNPEDQQRLDAAVDKMKSESNESKLVDAAKTVIKITDRAAKDKIDISKYKKYISDSFCILAHQASMGKNKNEEEACKNYNKAGSGCKRIGIGSNCP